MEVIFEDVYTDASGKLCALFSNNVVSDGRSARGLTYMEQNGE